MNTYYVPGNWLIIHIISFNVILTITLSNSDVLSY